MRNMKCAAVCVAVCALAVAGFADGEGKSLKDAFKGLPKRASPPVSSTPSPPRTT